VVGDMLHAGGERYEVVRVTGWAHDSSWHIDLARRAKSRSTKDEVRRTK
jgi:hypothetical protein